MSDSKRCNFCNLDFKCVPALVSHLRWNHDIRSTFNCDVCNENFINKKDLMIHRKSHKKPNIPLKCPICHAHFLKSFLLNHFKNSHNVILEKEKIEFESMDDFYEWKKNVECDTTSYYVMRTTAVKTKSGVTKTYVCHRDGNYVSRGKNKKKIKSIGSNKINGHCPSKLTVRTLNGKVIVEFVKTHVGHSMDIERINIPREEKEKIALKIASKVSFEDILDELKNSASESNLQRQHLITRKDLHNIVQKYKLNGDIESLNNESFHVDSWAKEMESNFEFIRFYKPKGVRLENHRDLKKDDFFLVLANDIQLQFLSCYGNGTISVDIIPAHSSCNFDLTTIMVLDDNREAFPCAFMFSSKQDFFSMKLLFRVVKQFLNCDICPEYFFSGTSEYVFSAWESVICKGFTTFMYNVWSLENDWRLNLASIPKKELQAQIYELLKSLMVETDLNVFVDKSNIILRKLYSTAETIKFANYIERFFKSPTPWAHCFRRNLNNDMNIGIENMWKLSELLYFKRKKSKQLDIRIYDLMQCFKDRMFCLLKFMKEITTFNFSDIGDQHKASMELSNFEIYAINEKWYLSSNTASEKYEVESDNLECNCKWRCEDCSACIHSYKCSCADCCIQWRMCKHIHLIATIVKHSLAAESFEDWMVPEPVIHCDVSSSDLNNETAEIIQVQQTEKIDVTPAQTSSVMAVEDVKECIKDDFFETLNIIETLEDAHVLQNAIAPVKEMILNFKQR